MLRKKHKRNNKNKLNNPYLDNKPNFYELSKTFPDFEKHLIKINDSYTIDWKNPDSLRSLNQALLKKDFDISYYNLPQGFLIPTIPSRLNYLLWINNILKCFSVSHPIKLLDIGTGCNLIYPLIGTKKFGWSFVGTDINDEAITNAKEIIEKNCLDKSIKVIKQENKFSIFKGVVRDDDKFVGSICNPPYYDSETEVKVGNAHTDNEYSGHEVYCEGGEKKFITTMVNESREFSENIFIFSSLIGKKNNYKEIKKIIKQNEAIKFFNHTTFYQGKNARWCVAWSYHSSYEEFRNKVKQYRLEEDREFLEFIPVYKEKKKKVEIFTEI